MYLYIQNDIEDNSFVEEKMLSFKNEAHKLKSIDDEKSWSSKVLESSTNLSYLFFRPWATTIKRHLMDSSLSKNNFRSFDSIYEMNSRKDIRFY